MNERAPPTYAQLAERREFHTMHSMRGSRDVGEDRGSGLAWMQM